MSESRGIAHARRLISGWLNDGHPELSIPNNPWGVELRGALEQLLSATSSTLFLVELWLDTTMWNEGFEKAELPWLRIFTDNESWVKGLPRSFSVADNSPFGQDFSVRLMEVTSSTAELMERELHELYGDDEEAEARLKGKQLGLSAQELNALLEARLAEWDGI